MERQWFKIGETALRLGVKPKDLRYWEQIIPEIRPRRSQGNLRYYHRDDLPRLERIRKWLEEGLTVADCRQLLLTGQLARGFDFGDEEEEEPAHLPPPRTPRQTSAPTRPAPTDIQVLLDMLSTLQKRLALPPGASRSFPKTRP
nr:MerR family transcriptional regulator [uncultured Holophaga sp.]